MTEAFKVPSNQGPWKITFSLTRGEAEQLLNAAVGDAVHIEYGSERVTFDNPKQMTYEEVFSDGRKKYWSFLRSEAVKELNRIISDDDRSEDG